MKVTDKQWEVAKATIDKLDLRRRNGKQPWFVLNRDGEELISDYRAVCLAALNDQWKTKFSHKGAVLFQVVNTTMENVKQSTISTFLTYMCNNSPVSKYIPRHTSKKRWEVGAVPICLENVPCNLPITASTYVRWMWDSHNTLNTVTYEWLVENMEMTRAEAFLLANCVDYSPAEKNRNSFSLRMWAGIHSPFCNGMSLESVNNFFNKSYRWDKSKFNTNLPGRGKGIHCMLREGGGDIDDLLKEVSSKFIQDNPRWGVPTIPVDEYIPVITTLLNELRKLK